MSAPEITDHYPRRSHVVEGELAGYCGHIVDLDSDTSVRALLFDEAALPPTPAFAVDDETLQTHAREHPSPITELVLEWRLAQAIGR